MKWWLRLLRRHYKLSIFNIRWETRVTREISLNTRTCILPQDYLLSPQRQAILRRSSQNTVKLFTFTPGHKLHAMTAEKVGRHQTAVRTPDALPKASVWWASARFLTWLRREFYSRRESIPSHPFYFWLCVFFKHGGYHT
jgi:hypothetical protein